MIIMTIIVALIMYQNVEDRNRAVLFLLLSYFLWNVWTMAPAYKKPGGHSYGTGAKHSPDPVRHGAFFP